MKKIRLDKAFKPTPMCVHEAIECAFERGRRRTRRRRIFKASMALAASALIVCGVATLVFSEGRLAPDRVAPRNGNTALKATTGGNAEPGTTTAPSPAELPFLTPMPTANDTSVSDLELMNSTEILPTDTQEPLTEAQEKAAAASALNYSEHAYVELPTADCRLTVNEIVRNGQYVFLCYTADTSKCTMFASSIPAGLNFVEAEEAVLNEIPSIVGQLFYQCYGNTGSSFAQYVSVNVSLADGSAPIASRKLDNGDGSMTIYQIYETDQPDSENLVLRLTAEALQFCINDETGFAQNSQTLLIDDVEWLGDAWTISVSETEGSAIYGLETEIEPVEAKGHVTTDMENWATDAANGSVEAVNFDQCALLRLRCDASLMSEAFLSGPLTLVLTNGTAFTPEILTNEKDGLWDCTVLYLPTECYDGDPVELYAEKEVLVYDKFFPLSNPITALLSEVDPEKFG